VSLRSLSIFAVGLTELLEAHEPLVCSRSSTYDSVTEFLRHTARLYTLVTSPWSSQHFELSGSLDLLLLRSSYLHETWLAGRRRKSKIFWKTDFWYLSQKSLASLWI